MCKACLKTNPFECYAKQLSKWTADNFYFYASIISVLAISTIVRPFTLSWHSTMIIHKPKFTCCFFHTIIQFCPQQLRIILYPCTFIYLVWNESAKYHFENAGKIQLMNKCWCQFNKDGLNICSVDLVFNRHVMNRILLLLYGVSEWANGVECHDPLAVIIIS